MEVLWVPRPGGPAVSWRGPNHTAITDQPDFKHGKRLAPCFPAITVACSCCSIQAYNSIPAYNSFPLYNAFSAYNSKSS